MGDRASLPNGLLPSSAAGFGRAIDVQRWSVAEHRTAELIERIMPSWPSEAHRNAVSGYVQRLIMNCFSCRVFTFGSVPLKTYLPDGDIDLTAFSENESLKDTWANDVCAALQNEEKNENAEFHVKEVQYIQAEVKIIKCLVEDIVVDISFNQVGGLCTLCFLDEVDSLIDQNHLFKKSIILIKAWCYYESRILGAHHGLISTYALETLVLYIFHVYNNSFAGPLEVLYRFLEFFSNFDWDNFCLSLLGPIPVSSLPEMTAERPRNDDGELLLSKLFLDVCNAFYAVFPAGQENQSQPFVSKYFNIVDPLRINNNLGRSVSKGNFFRIRNAFAFGAKRLGRLLECPQENLIAEVNRFFTNTWERHATSPNLWLLRPSKTEPAEELNNSQDSSIFKKKSENNAMFADQEYQLEDGHASEVLKTSSQQLHSLSRSGTSSALYNAQNKKSHGSQISSMFSDRVERETISRGSAQTHNQQRHIRPDHLLNDREGHDSFQFARTHSSPELTGVSADALMRGSHNMDPELGKNQIALNMLGHGVRINQDSSPPTVYLTQQIIDASDSHITSNNYHDSEEQIALVSETLDMHQEEQDFVNMLASSRAYNVNESVRLPTHLPSLVPIPLSSALIASIGYTHRNLGGIVPTSIPLIDPSRGSNMWHSQNTMSPPLPHYSPVSNLNLKSEDMVGSVYGGSGITSMDQDDEEQQGLWLEDEIGPIRSNPDNGGFKKPSSHDEKQASKLGIRDHHKLAIEHKGLVSKDDTVAFQSQSGRRNRVQSTIRNGHMVPVSNAVSPSRKTTSECSLDESDKTSTPVRENRRNQLAASIILKALYGKSLSRRQLVSSSSNNSSHADDEASPHFRKHGISRHEPEEISEPTEISGSDSMVPLPSVLSNSSQQRTHENSGAAPFAFYPTGPPVPFLAMLPTYNFPSDTSSSNRSTGQFYNDERLHGRHANLSGRNINSADSLDQPDVHVSSSSLVNVAPELSEEAMPDILNSDFVTHWQNLQYGRSCQNTRHLGPFMYPSPAMVPPVYLQGHFPWDGPGRPLSANLNLPSQIMSYAPPLAPVAPLQQGLGRNVFQRFGDEGPAYRGGTGTYLPNSKVSSRERSSSSTRNNRGSYNHDQNDADREGNWNNSKSRTAGRSHGRSRGEKAISRSDRLSSYDNRANRPWSHDLYQASQDSSFMSTNSSRNSLNMAYDMHPLAAANPNGLNPNRPAVPPYGSHTEGLDYGSLALVNLSGGNEIAQPSDETPAREEYQQRHGAYQGSSRPSSG